MMNIVLNKIAKTTIVTEWIRWKIGYKMTNKIEINRSLSFCSTLTIRTGDSTTCPPNISILFTLDENVKGSGSFGVTYITRWLNENAKWSRAFGASHIT